MTTPRGPRHPQQVWNEWQSANDALDIETAGRRAEEMTQVDPGNFFAWFEAGLHAKARRDWRRCAEWNLRAMQLFGPEQQEHFGSNPAAWNLGIAATALADWDLARTAWSTYGIGGLAEGTGPIDDDYGYVPIRINPDRPSLALQEYPDFGHTETLWCWRRSPAHAIIANVPLPDAGHRYRDVLLHDGEPKGKRQLGDREVSVFDELERLADSGLPTWQAEVSGATEVDVTLLSDLGLDRGLGVDDWSGLRPLCPDCSHGSPGPEHTHPAPAAATTRIGLGGDGDALRGMLDGWLAGRSRLRLLSLERMW